MMRASCPSGMQLAAYRPGSSFGDDGKAYEQQRTPRVQMAGDKVALDEASTKPRQKAFEFPLCSSSLPTTRLLRNAT